MATKHAPLSKLHDYELVHPEQDIRGWEVKDASGTTIGRVDDLLVSTDTELVEVIRLSDGEEYPASEIELGDRVVRLQGKRATGTGDSEPVVKVYDDARVRRRQGETGSTGATGAGTGTTAGARTGATGATGAGTGTTAGARTGATGYDAYSDDFRGHYKSNYGSAGNDYDYYEPAYRQGYSYATNDDYKGRDWNTVEPEMRRSYEERHGTGTWAKVKDAARHAFDRGRSGKTNRTRI